MESDPNYFAPILGHKRETVEEFYIDTAGQKYSSRIFAVFFLSKKKYCQPQRDEGGIHPIFLLLHFIIQHVLSNFSNLGTRLQLFVNIETNLKAIYCFVASEAVIFANIGSYSIHKYQCGDNDRRHGPPCYTGKSFRSHWRSGLCCYSFAK